MPVFITLGALFCFIGVASGALGAHALKPMLVQAQGFDNFNLAKDYMFYHGLALIAVGMLAARFPRKGFPAVGVMLVIGSVLFQGSLFAYSLSGSKSLTTLAPLGGVLLMLAWLGLAVGAWRLGTVAQT